MFFNILVVDDQKADQLLAEYAIRDYNPDANIQKAFDGEEALEILEGQAEIDLILLDINMPRMNGHEFLERYEKQTESSPVVVMLTSSYQQTDRESCERYAFVIAYLTKPLLEKDLEEITEKVSQL